MKKLIPSLLVVAFLLAFCGGGKPNAATTPEEAVKNLHAAILDLDGGALYNVLSKETAQTGEEMLKKYIPLLKLMAGQMQEANPEVKEVLGKVDGLMNKSGKEFYVALLKLVPDNQKEEIKSHTSYELKNVEIDGDKAKGEISVDGN